MRQTILVLSCALLSVAGCGDDTTSGKQVDMSVTSDLSVGPDLAVRMADGVVCGTMTCAVGQDCCVATSNNMATGETCIASGASCTGGSILACDGPEDCSSASAYCCATINLQAASGDGGVPGFAGGAASCTGTCGVTFAPDFSSITTRLCHAKADCDGLTVPFLGATSCCTSTAAPGIQFCAPPVMGVTTCL